MGRVRLVLAVTAVAVSPLVATVNASASPGGLNLGWADAPTYSFGTLDAALNHLSHTIRTTFILFAEVGLSYKEIAETQNVPIGTVMSRIHAAREKLQADLNWDKLSGL